MGAESSALSGGCGIAEPSPYFVGAASPRAAPAPTFSAAATKGSEGLVGTPSTAAPTPTVGYDADSEQSIAALVSHVVQQLAPRPNQTLLLSDLGALLPKDLRAQVKERGGLRSALQRFTGLFAVTGAPGKESVKLLINLGGRPAAGPSGSGAASSQQATGGSLASGARDDANEEDEDNDSAVQLRGLPYRATLSDVRAFLGRHASNLKEDHTVKPIQLILNRDGRPSGFAKIQFDSPEAARAARDSLNNQVMEVGGATSQATAPSKGATTRYVEVFLFSERPNKLRFKRNVAGEERGEERGEEEDQHSSGDTSAAQVHDECAAYMSTVSGGQLLLSMLGVALSTGARSYLKKTDQGLKLFLTRYPREFAVEGVKGREIIIYLPSQRQASIAQIERAPDSVPQGIMPEGLTNSEAPACERIGAPESGNISDLQHSSDTRRCIEERLLASPKMHSTPTPGLTPGADASRPTWYEKTPSVWGDSPLPGQHQQFVPVDVPAPDQMTGMTGPLGDLAAMAAAGQEGIMMDGMPLDPLMGMYPGSHEWAGILPPYMLSFPQAPPVPWMDPAASQGVPASAEVVQALVDHMAMLTQQQHQHQQQPSGLLSAHTGVDSQQVFCDSSPVASVRLRGLPFESTEQDVFSFFSKYDVVDAIHNGRDAVQLLAKPNGRKSGIAIVNLVSHSDAIKVRDVLQGKMMGSRYIEVFLVDGEEEQAEKPPRPVSRAERGSSAPVAPTSAPPPKPQARPQPQKQQPPKQLSLAAPPAEQQRKERSDRSLSPPPKLSASAACAFEDRDVRMDTPEIAPRVKWSDISSPSPFAGAGDTGGSGTSALLPEFWTTTSEARFDSKASKASAAPPEASAGTGDEQFKKMLFEAPELASLPAAPPNVMAGWGDLLAQMGQKYEGDAGVPFVVPPLPPPVAIPRQGEAQLPQET